MTEVERQRRIAAALYGCSSLLAQICDLHLEMTKRIEQLESLAKQFEAGRYLPKETHATGPDDPAPEPGESPAA